MKKKSNKIKDYYRDSGKKKSRDGLVSDDKMKHGKECQ